MNNQDFKIGDLVKSFDFEPMQGRTDRFVQGFIDDITDDGRFEIRVTFDSTDQDRQIVFTPIELFVTEFDGRIQSVNKGDRA